MNKGLFLSIMMLAGCESTTTVDLAPEFVAVWDGGPACAEFYSYAHNDTNSDSDDIADAGIFRF